MGCMETHLECPVEELEVIKKEMKLPYDTEPPSKIDIVHRKYSLGGKINQDQWEQIKSSLNFPNDLSFCDSFYSSFCDNGEYSLRGLVLLGILLSYGNFTDKALLIFEIMDLEYQNILTKADMEALVSELIDISVNKMSLLVEQDAKVQKYIRSLKSVEERGKKLILRRFCKGSMAKITREEFVERFYKAKCVGLLTARGIRKLLYGLLYDNPNSS